LLAWRSMMGTAASLARLRKLSPPGVISHHDYGSHPAERLEWIEPKAGSPARVPVVYVHGGGWICGKKELYTRELLFLAEAGHPVFNIEYPLAPENPHPKMLLSLLSALAWIREQHPEIESVHLMGDSAGGNLALMLGILCANPALTVALDPELSLSTPRPQTVISLYGVLDRLSWIEHRFPGAALMLECYAGRAALEPEVGPERAVTPMDLSFESLPPTLITVGSKDQLAASSRLCAERLQKDFDGVEYEVYPGEAHGFFNRGGRPACQQLRRDILEFLSKH
jgi:acetyl esterase